MRSWVQQSVAAHRYLESLLDLLEQAIARGEFAAEFGEAREAVVLHYAEEDIHWAREGVGKILRQHNEVVELAAGVEEALAGEKQSDALAIGRRFAALASHNLIEEERDWFPLL